MKTLAAALLVFASIAQADTPHTASGIPIDTDWKAKEYAYAVQNVVHPSWGITHSERDYQVTKKLADAQGIALDLDVLFACAFLHDLGGIGSFAQPGVDHAVRSAQLAEPLLQAWGFPMEKWAQVKEMILGHTYYGPVPASAAAFAFRDADILDFLGDIGIARILAITEEPGRASSTLSTPLSILRQFRKDFPAKLSSTTAQLFAQSRYSEMDTYFSTIDSETFDGSVP